MLYLLTLLSLSRGAFAIEACTAPPRPHAVDRRADFFRLRRLAEERERAREAGRAELAGRGDDRARRLEDARQIYIRTRRPKPDDAAADAAWKAALTERARRIEDARKCYVTQRDHAAEGSDHGRDVPADAEYGLDE